MKRLHTVEELADHFGIEPSKVVRRCSTSINPWPHLRPVETKSSTWRFTDEDVEAIEQRIRVRETTQDAWGRSTKKAS